MSRLTITATEALFLSACAATSTSEIAGPAGPDTAGMETVGMPCGCSPEMAGDMTDMCAKMMARKGGSGTPGASDEKTVMMADMKGCMMMPADGDSASGPPEALPDKAVDPDDHSAHHPPQ